MTTQINQNSRLIKFLQAPQSVQEEIERMLDGKPAAPKATTAGPLLLGMSQAARFLGVSRGTLWRVCRAGRLQKVELLPGAYRLRRTDLEALAAGKGEVS